jgi:hypothetical protein
MNGNCSLWILAQLLRDPYGTLIVVQFGVSWLTTEIQFICTFIQVMLRSPWTNLQAIVLCCHFNWSTRPTSKNETTCSERRGQVGSTPTFYSGGPGFKSWSGEWLFYQDCRGIPLFFQANGGIVPQIRPWRPFSDILSI